MSRRSQRIRTRESNLRPRFKTIQGGPSSDNSVQTSNDKFHEKKPCKSHTEVNSSCRRTIRNSKKNVRIFEQIETKRDEDHIQNTNLPKKSSKKATTVVQKTKTEEKLDSGQQSPTSMKNSKNICSPTVVTVGHVRKKASQNEKSSGNKRKKKTVKSIVESEQVPVISNDDKLLQKKFNLESTLRRSTRTINSKTVVKVQNKTENSAKNKKINSVSVPINNNVVVKQNEKKFKETGNSKVKVASNAAKSPLISKLRERKIVKYAESSLEMSQAEENPNKKKIPIYKQIIAEKPTKRKGDLYEFDEDTEKYKKRKKLTRESDEYNKTMQSILKNIMNRNKIKKKNIFCEQKNKKTTINRAAKTKKGEPHVKFSTHKLELGGDKEIVNTETRTQKNQNVLDVTVLNNQNYPTDNDDCFGFVPNDSVESPKIKIISDVQLQTRNELNFSIGSPTLFNRARPNANSTMLNNRQSNTVSNSVLTPWRFNEINVRRNPHFISLKNSSLPSLSQEMVLDHTLVDKFEDMSKSVTKKNTTHKEIKEKHLENKENTSSLFDIELSPIKTANKISFRSPLLKRKILGEKNDNVIESEVPSFGFNTSTEEIIESVKNKEDGPFRFSINMNDKKYERKKVKMIKEKIKSLIYDSEESGSNSENDSDSESECGDVKLFEEFTSTQDRLELSDMVITKNKKSRKRKENGNLQTQKKLKNIRTKEEEEEAEQWAVAFNSMCEEIDQFPLEVE